MNIAKSYDFFKPEDCKDRIHIIGCGAIGSTLAENLARYGLTKITLYDFDTVVSHNIANQIYEDVDIGQLKVEALAKHLVLINPDIGSNLKLMRQGYTGQRLDGYVFLCVDSIGLRREIANANKNNIYLKAMFDFRMGLTDAQHYAADWSNKGMVTSFIDSMDFTSEEAQANTPVSACNLTLSVNSTVRMIVAAGVGNFVNFVKGRGLKKFIMTDAFNFILDAA